MAAHPPSAQPEIVALATPASLRGEVVEAATALGCHLYCDKPLATTAEETGRLYHLVERAGVKHAYASTHRYDPSVVWLGELVRDGAIRTVREIDYTWRAAFSPLIPWSWFDMLATGGGVLNQTFTHVLGMVTTITGGDLLRAMGQARPARTQAPVVPDIHDFRLLFAAENIPTSEAAANLEWRACDADHAVSALLAASSAIGEVTVSVTISLIARTPWPANGFRLYGDARTLLAEGVDFFTVYRLGTEGTERELLPVPPRLLDDLPAVGDYIINHWAALARDFVADVRGEAHRPYLTFRDGWRYQEAIDAIRSGRGWYTLPA